MNHLWNLTLIFTTCKEVELHFGHGRTLCEVCVSTLCGFETPLIDLALFCLVAVLVVVFSLPFEISSGMQFGKSQILLFTDTDFVIYRFCFFTVGEIKIIVNLMGSFRIQAQDWFEVSKCASWWLVIIVTKYEAMGWESSSDWCPVFQILCFHQRFRGRGFN